MGAAAQRMDGMQRAENLAPSRVQSDDRQNSVIAYLRQPEPGVIELCILAESEPYRTYRLNRKAVSRLVCEGAEIMTRVFR